MKVSYNWLKDYVDIELGPEELAERLTASGFKVELLEKLPDLGDTVLTIEVTSNRPDCLSMVGIAREIGAITGARLKLPVSGPSQSSMGAGPSAVGSEIKVQIEALKQCQLYIARLLRGVKIGPSPEWIIRRLKAVGIRPINNVVDITNFVLMELGQPLHAFDYDKIIGKKIIVRLAKEDEKITTLDGLERELNTETLVIADKQDPVALAGIMGGTNTEVSTETSQVLLESAYFEPIGIRRTSRRLGLMTESSYRFERNVDPLGVELASLRAASLIEEIAGAKLTDGPVIAGEVKVPSKEICIAADYPSRILGVKVQKEDVISIFARLGLEPIETEPSKIKVTIPSWRQDLDRPIDLVEEVARIYRYDRIPSTLPRIDLKIYPSQRETKFKNKILQALIGAGFYEVITYNLISQQMLDRFSYIDEPPVRLKDPLNNQQEFMRTSLLPGLAWVIGYNLNRRAERVKIFELGRVYFDNPTHPVEKLRLGIGLEGIRQVGWPSDKTHLDFFDLKAVIELILEELKITNFRFKPKDIPCFLKGESAELILLAQSGKGTSGIQAGILGQLAPNVATEVSLPEGVYLAEIFLDKIFQQATDEKKYQPVPRFPWAGRDVAVIVPLDVEAQKVEDLIRKTGGGLVDKVVLFDVYEGKQIPADCRSLAFSIRYLDRERTLTDEEVEAIHRKICDTLQTELNARLR